MIRAVIFDMFETLVTHYRSPIYFGENIAEDLGLPEDTFREDWDPTGEERSLGGLTFEQTIERIMEKNAIASPELLKRVVDKRLEAKREIFHHLHSEIIPVLEQLRERGIRLGLISNCFSEEVRVIRESILCPYFDAVCLSFEQGVMKPDREIYFRCMRELSVAAEECLYVGDGGSRELETAGELGMRPFQAVWYFGDNHRRQMEYRETIPRLERPLELLEYL